MGQSIFDPCRSWHCLDVFLRVAMAIALMEYKQNRCASDGQGTFKMLNLIYRFFVLVMIHSTSDTALNGATS